MPTPCRLKLSLLGLVFSVPIALLSAEISVDGLRDKATYVDRVGFRVRLEAGYHYRAWLDSREVAPQFWQFASDGYHQFVVSRTHNESQTSESRLYRFVVQDSQRGNSEWGLRPWTPHPWIHSAEAEFADAHLELVYPKSLPSGIPLPIIATIREEDRSTRRVNGNVTLGARSESISIRRGVGFNHVTLRTDQEVQTHLAQIARLTQPWTVKVERDSQWTPVSGTIIEDTTWHPHSRILIEGDLLVLPETTLTIEEGAVIAIAKDVDITVAGELHVNGSAENPVLMTPTKNKVPWGGFILREGPASVNVSHTIVTGSGAHKTWFFANRGNRSHRPEQAAFYFGRGTSGQFDHVYMIANAGQALHGENANITLKHSLIQQCQTAGQFNEGSVTIESSALIEFPFEDPHFVDGDNDALYFTFGTHQIRDTLIGWTKDDGIDAGGNDPGRVIVERCWFESCFHEGMALSGTDKIVSVKDSVFLNNGQGVEVGYLSPKVEVMNSLLSGNLVGLRFGDNYFREHSGSLTAMGSIAIFNERDVWGMTANLWDEDFAQMNIVDNFLGDGTDRFPENTAWLTQVNHAESLTRFLPSKSTSPAIGFVQSSQIAPTQPGTVSITIGLSQFSAHPITAQLELVSPIETAKHFIEIIESDIQFDPGQTYTTIPIKILHSGLALRETPLRLHLSGPENATLSPHQSEFILLFEGLNPSNTIVAAKSDWNFQPGIAEVSTPTNAWTTSTFDDSGWQRGPAPFGYGTISDGTHLTAMRGNYSSIFLRKPFHLSTLSNLDALTFESTYTAGFILWLNGTEITRLHVPDGSSLPVTTKATRSSETTQVHVTDLPVSQLQSLRAGFNQLAVQVFNHRIDNPALSFDLAIRSHEAIDLDQDGLPDQWESDLIDAIPDDPYNALTDVHPDADPDQDSHSNRSEYLANTNPLDPSSHLRILSVIHTSPDQIQIAFNHEPGRHYSIQARSSLQAPWNTVIESAASPNRHIHRVVLPVSTETNFFRVLSRF